MIDLLLIDPVLMLFLPPVAGLLLFLPEPVLGGPEVLGYGVLPAMVRVHVSLLGWQ